MDQVERVTYAQLNARALEECPHWLADGSSFGIVSAQDSAAEDALRNRLHSLKLGFRRLTGHWHQLRPGRVQQHLGQSYCLVQGLSLNQVLALRESLDLDFVVHAGPESGGDVTFLGREGGTRVAGPFDPARLAHGYSRARGAPFEFKGFEALPNCWAAALAREHRPLVIVDAPGPQ